MEYWISLSPKAGEEKAKCIQGNPRLADAFDALEYLLRRDPTQGVCISDKLGGVFEIISSDAGVPDMPIAKMLYRYNSKGVAVMHVKC
ncbi:MAG: hypothetical protein NBV67_10410 [Tagaea sp.]|nr:hypothetical protein [Tagaea sp.]